MCSHFCISVSKLGLNTNIDLKRFRSSNKYGMKITDNNTTYKHVIRISIDFKLARESN